MESVNTMRRKYVWTLVFVLCFINTVFSDTWAYTNTLIGSCEHEYDYMGFSVAADGHYIAIGSPYCQLGLLSDVGKVCVVNTDDSNSEQVIQPSGAQASDHIGYAVAINSQWLAIGAPLDDTQASDDGAVYIYRLSDNEWVFETKIYADTAQEGRLFGESLSLSGNQLIVGARYDNTIDEMSGGAYIFEYKNQTWQQESLLTPSGYHPYSEFGWSVTIEDDRAIVTSRFDHSLHKAVGSVYVFEKTDGLWAEHAKFTPDKPHRSEGFGYKAVLSGDTIFVSATKASYYSNRYVGAVYLYEKNNDNWVHTYRLSPDDLKRADEFGSDICVKGDTLVVSAEFHDVDLNKEQAGAAYVYRLVDSIWEFETKLVAPDSQFYDRFGRSVALLKNSIAVGAPYKDHMNDTHNKGCVYLFEKTP